MIPFVLSLVLGSMGAGFSTRKLGFFTQWIYLSAVIMPIGAGIISTFKTTTPHAKWIGYQIIFGFGLGLGMQQPSLACQTTLNKKDVPTGASLIFFAQNLGGAVFTSVGSNVFNNKLAQGLKGAAGLDAAAVVQIGATQLRDLVRPEQLPEVLREYNGAIVDCFYVGVTMSCAAVFGAIWMPWVSIKQAAAGQETKGGPIFEVKLTETNDEKV
jgi:hypothetical protein